MAITKEVRMTVTAPVECSNEQFDEWIDYKLGVQAEISSTNPLAEYDLEATSVDVW